MFFFQMLYFYVEIFLDNFESLHQKSFYINLFVSYLIVNLAYYVDFNQFDLFKQSKLMARLQFWIPRLWFQHLLLF